MAPTLVRVIHQPVPAAVVVLYRSQRQVISAYSDGGQITANTYASGDSGTVNIKADELFIDNVDNSAWYTGVLVTSDASASGDAQDISIERELQRLLQNGSEIPINTLRLRARGLAYIVVGR